MFISLHMPFPKTSFTANRIILRLFSLDQMIKEWNADGWKLCTYLKAWLNFNYTFISFLCWLMLWVHLHACSIKILDRRLPNLRYSNTTTTFDVLRLCVIHTYLTTRVVFLLKNKCVSFYGQLKHLFYLLLLLKVISTWNGSNKTESNVSDQCRILRFKFNWYP